MLPLGFSRFGYENVNTKAKSVNTKAESIPNQSILKLKFSMRRDGIT